MSEQEVLAIDISNDEDVIFARQKVRLLTQEIGFSSLDQTRIITAVSELARNIVVHAKTGRVSAFRVDAAGRKGIKVVFEDKGQGIADIEKAMTDGFSSVHSLGIGLKGAKRLVDEFDLKSARGLGTTVVVTKWK